MNRTNANFTPTTSKRESNRFAVSLDGSALDTELFFARSDAAYLFVALTTTS